MDGWIERLVGIGIENEWKKTGLSVWSVWMDRFGIQSVCVGLIVIQKMQPNSYNVEKIVMFKL